MELRLALLVVAASMPAVAGFQAAMRVGAMQPAMAARAPSTAMLVDPAMLDTSAIVEAPTQLLALKSEADEIIDTAMSFVFPVGTAVGLLVRRRSPPFCRACACSVRGRGVGCGVVSCIRPAMRVTQGGKQPAEAQPCCSCTLAARRLSNPATPTCGTLAALSPPHAMPLTTQLPRGERATNATHHPQAIVKGLVDDQLEAGIVSQIIFLAVLTPQPLPLTPNA